MRILIADDNHSVRRALQVMLEALGHEVAGIAVDGSKSGSSWQIGVTSHHSPF
jgi:CheY-like chemotaxis protein